MSEESNNCVRYSNGSCLDGDFVSKCVGMDCCGAYEPINPTEYMSRKPDWNAYLTSEDIIKHCRLWNIPISNNPTYFELQQSAEKLSEKYQQITKL